MSRYVKHITQQKWGDFISNRYGCFGDVKQKSPKVGTFTDPWLNHQHLESSAHPDWTNALVVGVKHWEIEL